jgi:predicted CXXCH cytochrome family protein
VALLLSFLPAFLSGAQEPPEKLDPSAPCATSECHTSLGKYAYIHEPAEEDCTDCHSHEGDEHEFTTEESPALCMDCHEISEAIEEAKHSHEPAEDDCLDCHDPHGSQAKGLLSTESQPELCFDCHDEEEILEHEYGHGPVREGACTQCHDPHSSSNGQFLVAEGSDLCLGCHEELADAIKGAKYVHDPAEDDCTDCHDPHTGPYPMMLPAKGWGVCDECHDDIVELAKDAEVDHAPAATGDGCLNCHSPHAAQNPAILQQPQVDLCLGCHDERLKSSNPELTDMKSWMRNNPEWHQAIHEDQCTGCHEPHGGEGVRLLKGRFPAGFYSDFNLQDYGLCFSCHESSAMTSERTRTLTDFRDGDRNLHFLHVNRQKRGRSCRACHEVHASRNLFNLRRIVPYGRWMMPMRFESVTDGGSCRPGCHEEETYERTKGQTGSASD